MSNILLLVLLVGVPLLIGVVALSAYFLMGRQKGGVEERLDQFTRVGPVVETPAAARPAAPKGSALSERLSDLLTRRKFGESIARDLARADIKLNVGEYFALHIILFFGFFVVAWFMGGGGFNLTLNLSTLVNSGISLGAGLIGLLIPRMYVGFMKGQRLAKFDNQLGDMLNLVVNGLRAGYSVMQALEAVSKELPPPISTEFKRVVQEMQLGLPMETALSNLVRRIPSKDLDFVVTAINVQREVGGNLAEILDTISYTIRERVRIKGEIATLTAQGMMTGYVISFLPIGLGFFLFLVNRPYMMSLFTPPSHLPCGIIMVVTVFLLIGSGFLIVKKIVSIEI